MEHKPEKLIFIYNADSSVFSQVSDALKKVVAPDKYQCSLCMITYGPISMKDEWKKFLDTLPFQKEFLHRDEIKERLPEFIDLKLPTILISDNGSVKVLVSSEEINDQKNLQGLTNLVKEKLETMYPLRI